MATTGPITHISPKHLQRYIDEFAGRQGVREMDTIDQMGYVAQRMAGKRLSYRELIA